MGRDYVAEGDVGERTVFALEAIAGHLERLVELVEPLLTAQTTIVARPPGYVDKRPHSRACGLTCGGHGPACAPDCPTCHPYPTAPRFGRRRL